MGRCRNFWGILVLCLMLVGAISARNAISEQKNMDAAEDQAVISPDQLRHVILHDAGNIYCPFYDGAYSLGLASGDWFDPETDSFMTNTTYPAGSGIEYIFMGVIWVGGIVNNDTLVSTLHDGWGGEREMYPANTTSGGSYRTGDFGDDEFATTIFDTLTSIYMPDHTPLNIEVIQKSYSWADSLYDDFVLVDYTIKNIGNDDIADGWAGILLDNDIFHASSGQGYSDDCSGVLDTLLDIGDPSSRALIGYSFDNNGDPSAEGLNWADESPKGAISLRLLGADFSVEHVNFNWWVPNSNFSLDFGPRRIGTPEDPFFVYSNFGLGTPGNDPDRYYLLSHPEIDYDQLNVAIEDSATGWIPAANHALATDVADGFDTRFVLSFGPFDLPAGDSVTFTVALVAADNVHVNPSDFADYFDADNPDAFYQTLDFSELLLHHKLAEDVYQSGYTLPIPGPPVGLIITAFNDTFADLAWHACDRPDLAGYSIYFRDLDGDSIWYKVNAGLISDTAYTVSLTDSLHLYEFAVTTTKTGGVESLRSDSIGLIPNTPHIVAGVQSSLQGMSVELQWDYNPDSDIEQYNIYKRNTTNVFTKFDSTANNYYLDATTESGHLYKYYITAMNTRGVESLPSDTVQQFPMALDQGILMIDVSSSNIVYMSMPFDSNTFNHLYDNLSAIVPVAKRIDKDSLITFPEMSHYSPIVFFAESRVDAKPDYYNSIRYYMQQGGRGLFIVANADFTKLLFGLNITPTIAHFKPGDIEFDVFKLDSAVRNVGALKVSEIPGDLAGCASLSADYGALEVDTLKFENSPLLSTYLPGYGFMYPRAEAEPIYSYVSSVPDTINNGQINGIRYLGDDYQFVMFNFPLTVMKEDGNYYALVQALNDLGVDTYCGDTNDDDRVNVGDIVYLVRYIYFGGPEPAILGHADINCDGVINLGDAVGIINYIFREGTLQCCQ